MVKDIQKLANEFYEACIIKQAKVKKLPNGKWTVVSRKGKHLGTYNTKQEAVKRLRQIEFFKSHPQSKKASKEISYSYLMRELKKTDIGLAEEFAKTFKKIFDYALVNNLEEPENIALLKTIEELNPFQNIKTASAIDLGDPEFAGRYLADILKFIMKRISSEKRPKSLKNLKNKVYFINEYDIASKKVPPSSAIGTSITLLKHILLDHDPKYIRAVLNAVSRNL